MAEQSEQSAQSSKINTAQPTVLKGLKLKTHTVETVNVAHPTIEDRVMKINKADYDEGVHGEILKDKLPKKKKKKSAAKKEAAEKDED